MDMAVETSSGEEDWAAEHEFMHLEIPLKVGSEDSSDEEPAQHKGTPHPHRRIGEYLSAWVYKRKLSATLSQHQHPIRWFAMVEG